MVPIIVMENGTPESHLKKYLSLKNDKRIMSKTIIAPKDIFTGLLSNPKLRLPIVSCKKRPTVIKIAINANDNLNWLYKDFTFIEQGYLND